MRMRGTTRTLRAARSCRRWPSKFSIRTVVIKGANARRFLVNEVERDDADQHEQRTYGRINKELYRRVDAALAAPDSDQENIGTREASKKKIKQQQIQRDENADSSPTEATTSVRSKSVAAS